GVAGLAAAQRLHSAGRDVLVLEARERLGGRVATLRLPGWPIPVELGAEFVHGRPPELWQRLQTNRIGAVPSRHRLKLGDDLVDAHDMWDELEQRMAQAPAHEE